MVYSNLETDKAAMAAYGILPATEHLKQARKAIVTTLQEEPTSDDLTKASLNSLKPGLNKSSTSARYYGFVTGGATPVSRFADNIVTEADQNVQVHLPDETIATDVEDAALGMICQLIGFDAQAWDHKTFTTGATASNLVGLACGREYVIQHAGARLGKAISIAQLGLAKAMREAEINDIQILTTVPHSSIRKVASIVGLGHDCVVDVGRRHHNQRHLFDYDMLEGCLMERKNGVASIIVVSCAEVNTGLFATQGLADFQKLRKLADEHKAWIHVDAAIGLLARVLKKTETPQYSRIIDGVSGIELANSIAGDAHKLFNVPYDCGIFLSRHLDIGSHVFQNPGAAYLAGGSTNVPSPLNIGIENSRRFRALPVYANLIRYGRKGYRDMLMRQIELARKVAKFIQGHEGYELLPPFVSSTPVMAAIPPDDEAEPGSPLSVPQTIVATELQKPKHQVIDRQKQIDNTFMVVCFRAVKTKTNDKLANHIKATKVIYASGTRFWDDKLAVRFAISNWQADDITDYKYIVEVLRSVC